MAAVAQVVPPGGVLLDGLTDERRRPVDGEGRPSPVGPGFDTSTLYFDVIRVGDGRTVAIGPPLLDLSARLDLAFDVPVEASRTLDRQHQIWLAGDLDALQITAGDRSITAPVSEPAHDTFAGRRVLLTVSRDNPLPWILDWARFHRDEHGADAILVYDNASTLYSPHDLAAHLSSLAGFQVVVVVDWPFTYGPAPARPKFGFHYCQLGALEHARWRFLQRARSVMNGDVDELVLAPPPGVFRLAELSPWGVVRYHGRWIVDARSGSELVPMEDRRHIQYTTVVRTRRQVSWRGPLPRWLDVKRSASKWTVVPRRIPWSAQWRIHDLAPWRWQRISVPGVSHRHFRPISTDWSYGRDDVSDYDPSRHAEDHRLSSSFSRVDWQS